MDAARADPVGEDATEPADASSRSNAALAPDEGAAEVSPLLASIAARPSPRPRAEIALARVVAWDGARLLLEVDERTVEASRDRNLHPNVLDTALRTGEVVLVSEREGRFTVMGALRTQPTPGIDVGEEFHIRADRIRVAAEKELSLSAVAATVVLRAAGEVETYADRIVSRAEQLHKIVGRMLRLN